VSEFTHDISIVASIAGLDPIEVYATQTIDEVVHFSRGVIDDANPEIPGTTGGLAGNRPDFLLVIAKGDTVQVELDNGDAMDVSLLKGQTFGMLSGKTFTRTTDAGDTAVSADAVGLNTVVGGRGNTFEYLAVTKEPADPCEGALQITVTDENDAAIAVRGSAGFVTAVSPSGMSTTYANADGGIALDELGVWCVYPSDSDGNASGTYLEIGIGFTGVDPVDFSPMNGSGPLSVVISNGFEVSGVNWAELTLPNLVGSNERLVLEVPLPNLTTVNNPSGSKFAEINIKGPVLTSASIDLLCNALDATATGRASLFTGTAAATAASLANRNAYIANGNALTFSP
jgi:hypothetical protein